MDANNQSEKLDFIDPPAHFADIHRSHIKPGVFMVHNKKHDKLNFDKTWDSANGSWIRIMSTYRLRPFDAVLLSVIMEIIGQEKAINGQESIKLYPKTKDQIGHELITAIELKADSVNKVCATTKTSIRKIANLMRIEYNGQVAHEIKESIIRLYNTNFVLTRIKKNGKKEYEITDMAHLISYSKSEWETHTKGGRNSYISICINTVLAEALVGGGNFVRLDMDLLRSFTRRPAVQLMLIYITANVDPGKTRFFTNTQLCEMIYGEVDKETPANTIRSQTYRTRKILIDDIGKIAGWTITKKTDGIEVSRAYIKKSPNE